MNFKGLQEKSAFLKITAQAFEAGDSLNIILVFEAHLFIKNREANQID